MTTEVSEAPLSQAEATELDACEQVIESGVQVFIEVGQALLTIREKRLYRTTHKTFEAYCRERWRFGRDRATQLMRSAEVAEMTRTTCSRFAPTEAQARQLAPLRDDPEKVREVWQKANDVAQAEGRRLTAKDIHHVRELADPLDVRDAEARWSKRNPGTTTPLSTYGPDEAMRDWLDTLDRIFADMSSMASPDLADETKSALDKHLDQIEANINEIRRRIHP